MLAWAGDFESNQLNLKVKSSDYGIEFRQYTQSNRSHIQIEKYTGNFKFAYRYDENGSKTEHRPRIDYKLYDNGTLYVKPRVEYRYYEGDLNDYWRVRSAIGFKLAGAYFEITPMLRLGEGYEEDLSIDEYQTKIGYKFKVGDKAQLNMFVQRDDDKHFNKKDLFFGTGFTINF